MNEPPINKIPKPKTCRFNNAIPYDIYHFHSAGEPLICKHFGCGKTSTKEEGLYGDKCEKHSGEQQSPAIFR